MNEQIARAEAILAAAGVASPRFDATELAAHLLGIPRLEASMFEGELGSEYDALIARRAQREPLQHIVGTAPFGPLELQVGPGVFIPRPETEFLAHWATEAVANFSHSGRPVRVVDLCTGSGALAAYIAHYGGADVELVAVELSAQALEYARRNCPGQVHVVHADVTARAQLEADPVLASWAGKVDIVVCNPPYVPERDADLIDAETAYDPHMAVFSGYSGLDLTAALLPTVQWLLAPGGVVGIEHDNATQEQTLQLLRQSGGFTNIVGQKDLVGRPRFVVATLAPDVLR